MMINLETLANYASKAADNTHDRNVIIANELKKIESEIKTQIPMLLSEEHLHIYGACNGVALLNAAARIQKMPRKERESKKSDFYCMLDQCLFLGGVN